MQTLLSFLLIVILASNVYSSGSIARSPEEMAALSVLIIDATVKSAEVATVYEDRHPSGIKIRNVDVFYYVTDIALVKNEIGYVLPVNDSQLIKTFIPLSSSHRGDPGVVIEVGSRHRFFFESVRNSVADNIQLYLHSKNNVEVILAHDAEEAGLQSKLNKIRANWDGPTKPLYTRIQLEEEAAQLRYVLRKIAVCLLIIIVITAGFLVVYQKRRKRDSS